jgi:hypothetical protein
VLTLRTRAAVAAGAVVPARAKAEILTLAGGRFAVPGGQVEALVLRLTPKARALLARLHTVRVRATLAAHDAAGATHTTVQAASLRQAGLERGKA